MMVKDSHLLHSALLTDTDTFSMALKDIPVMMHSIDDKGNIIFVNDYWLAKMGYVREEVIGKKSVDFLAEECAKLAREIYLPDFFQKGNCLDVPYTFVKRSGEHLDVLLSATSNIDENGKMGRSFAVLTDVTARNRFENMLRENNLNIRTLIDGMPNGFALHEIICDSKGEPCDYRFVQTNPAYDTVTGLNSNDIIGSTVLEVLPDIDMFWIKTFGKVALERTSIHFERFDPLFKKYFEVHAFSPNKKQFAVVFTDITERKLSEVAISQSEKLFRRTFDQSPIGVAMLDLNGCFIKVNQELCRITGYTTSELKEMNYLAITHPSDRENSKKQVAALLAGEIEQLEIDKRYIRKDGRSIWTRVSSRIIKDTHNKPLYFIPMVQDIDERKRLSDEKALQLELLKIITQESNLTELVQNTLKILKDFSSVDAIAMRLKKGEDFPYFVTHGFPESFVKRESSICSEKYGLTGQLHNVHHPKVECMCGCVISGRVLQFAPFFTNNGSFCTNSTTLLLAGIDDCEKYEGLRKHCNEAGYESVLLIPLKAGDKTIGLIQFNDQQKNTFPSEFVQIMERLSYYISVAVGQRLAEEELFYKQVELEETNAALKVLARNREEELQENSKELLLNIRQLVLPYVERLKLSNLDMQQQAQLKILESNLSSIAAPLNRTMASASSLLTPSLLQVADMIRNGLTNKEIAKVLGISVASVETYRKRIRSRLNLQNSKINLRTYLLDMR